MIKATSLTIGHTYYDKEIEDYFTVLSFKEGTPDVTVKYDAYDHPEVLECSDLLKDAYWDGFTVPVKKLHPDAIIPEYKTAGAAGFDLHITEDITIPANRVVIGHKSLIMDKHLNEAFSNLTFTLSNDNHAIVGTGLAFEIPYGYEMEIRGRSGNVFKDVKIVAYNGTIDADYRGEVKLLLTNLGKDDVTFKKGERLSQGVIKRVEQALFLESEELSETERGDKGFNSTGRS